jgi:hypothetical protein
MICLACIDASEMVQSPFGGQSRRLLDGLAPVGSDVNLQMVRGGQAFAYRQYLSQCNAAAYLGEERGAEFDRQGVWSVPGGIERPWDFRHGRRGNRPAAAQNRRPAAELLLPGGRHYRCREIGSYARAQELLRQGHTYLDGDGDGEACERLRR